MHMDIRILMPMGIRILMPMGTRAGIAGLGVSAGDTKAVYGFSDGVANWGPSILSPAY